MGEFMDFLDKDEEGWIFIEDCLSELNAGRVGRRERAKLD